MSSFHPPLSSARAERESIRLLNPRKEHGKGRGGSGPHGAYLFLHKRRIPFRSRWRAWAMGSKSGAEGRALPFRIRAGADSLGARPRSFLRSLSDSRRVKGRLFAWLELLLPFFAHARSASLFSAAQR